MSATGRGAPRHGRDFYPTPDELVRWAVDLLFWEHQGQRPRILEPSAGAGAWVRRLAAVYTRSEITAVEPFETPQDLPRVQWETTTLEESWKDLGRFDLIVGNPPFKHAAEHVDTCLGMLELGGLLAFVLPVSFMHSRKRAALMRSHAPFWEYRLTPRPSFSGNGQTDSAEYSLCVWGRGLRPHEKTITSCVEWKK